MRLYDSRYTVDEHLPVVHKDGVARLKRAIRASVDGELVAFNHDIRATAGNEPVCEHAVRRHFELLRLGGKRLEAIRRDGDIVPNLCLHAAGNTFFFFSAGGEAEGDTYDDSAHVFKSITRRT